MEDQQKSLKYLIAVETLAEEILSDRRTITMMDKRRNENREALRDLKKSGQRKCWITIGSILVKKDSKEACELLEKDQCQLNIDINKLRSDLKVKVNNLRDMEMQPPVPGLMLVPMSNQETRAMTSTGLIPS